MFLSDIPSKPVLAKQFYRYIIFFLGLTTAVGLLHSLLYALVGADLLTRPSFANFFLVGNLISLISTTLLLLYFYKRHYRAAFLTGLFAAYIVLLRAMLVYCLLVPITRTFESYYLPLLFLDIGANIVYASCLVFSRTGQNSWLKAAGVYYFLIGVSALALLIWSIRMHIGPNNATLESSQQWLSFAGSLSPLLLLGYFWQQQRMTTSLNTDSSLATWQATLLETARFITVTAFLILGVSLLSESIKVSRPSPKSLQMAQLFEARTFTNQRGDTLRYRLLKPVGYDATKKYPLVVSLHGGAGYGTDNIRQLDNWEAQELATPENQKKYPAFVLVPQCPRGSSWGGLPKLLSRDSLVFAVMTALEQEFTIDTLRRYVAGGSLGGYGTWHFIGTRPGVFAAAIPMCGEGNPALAKNMVDVGVWAFHGELDKNVPVSGSRAVINAIQQAGGHPRYTEFAEVAHNLWPEISNVPGLFDWLFAQKRDGAISRQTILD